MNRRFTLGVSLLCSFISIFALSINAQSKLITYWDFNLTFPLTGNGTDSLGTRYSYNNSPGYALHSFSGSTDSTKNTATLYPTYSTFSSAPTNSYIVIGGHYTPSPSLYGACANNNNGACYYYDYASNHDYFYVNHPYLAASDTTSSANGKNMYIRVLNPIQRDTVYLYLPTTGYQNIQVSYAISAASTNTALYRVFQYSTNGGTSWRPLASVMDTFNTATHSGGTDGHHADSLQSDPTITGSNWKPVNINFSSDPTVNNNAGFVLRWWFLGGVVTSTKGNDRYDNFALTGDSVCPNFVSQPTNVTLCSPGVASFSVAVIGGTLPYTYQWDVNSGSGFTAISNGGVYSGATSNVLSISNTSGLNGYQYECVVSNPSCGNITSNVVTLTSDLALSISVTSYTNVTCAGNGSAIASESGGTSPYTYSWSNSQTNATATNLSAGTYTVTVKDVYGCSASANVTISQTAVAVSISSSTNADCNGGTATASAAGGVTPYTYSWNSTPSQSTITATGLSAGSYTVTLTDASGCTSTAGVTILNIQLRDSINASGQYEVIDYWDFNNTPPAGGAGGDSLGTSTYPLPAQYSVIPGANPMIYYTRPVATQPGAGGQDGILDNGTQGGAVNDLHILGNDSGGTAAGNLYVRSRNPDENAYMYLYLPTSGFSNVVLNYAISASSTSGATYNYFSYSTNGGGTWKKLTTAMDTFNLSGVREPDTLLAVNSVTKTSGWYPVQINFSSDASVNNNPNFIVRWTFLGTTSAGASGNDRYDNISLSGNLVTENCNGASDVSLSAGVKYGTSPYTYSWSTGSTTITQSNLSAGTYSLTVQDAQGCSVSSSITISNPPQLSVAVNSFTNASCNGSSTGTATASPSGGTSPYYYSWSPVGGTGATGTGFSAGTYTVTTTDAFGCSASSNVTISQPAVLGASIASYTNVTCSANGSATASGSGGTTPYTYSWSNSETTVTATNLTAGTYTVSLKDANGCTASASVTISQTSLTVSISSYTNSDCNGGTATASPSLGTQPYTYSWSSTPSQSTVTATGLSAGSYTVNVTDAIGCTASASVSILNIQLRDSITTSGQYEVIDYWDFNNTLPAGGGGHDSLGTSTNPLPAQYTSVPGGNPRIVYNRPIAIQTSPLVATVRDSILDNVTPGAAVNDLPILGNDTSSLAANNLAVRSRNPDENQYMTLYLPTTGYSNIVLNYAVSESSTSGATWNVFQYSVDGGNTWNKLASVMDTFKTSGIHTADTMYLSYIGKNGWYPVQINFSSDQAVNNNPNFIVRWQFEGKNSNGTSGNDQYDNVSLSGNLISETCNGGSSVTATAGVKYGVSPYTYSWSGGGSSATEANLSAGTYTLTVQDAEGCSASSSATITNPPAIGITISSVQNIYCNSAVSGAIYTSESGGTSPYNYTWSPSGGHLSNAIGIAAGTYTLTVTDFFGCSASASATVSQPAALSSLSTHVTNLSCSIANSGSATASISGGTTPYTYSWSGGASTATATGLSAGTYTVTLKDNCGVSASATATLTQATGLSLSSSQTNVSCNGANNGSATVTVSAGTAPYTYSWSPTGGTSNTATGLAPGNYTVNVTDQNGCSAETNVTITQPAALNVILATLTFPDCSSGATGTASVAVGGGTAPYTYTWSPNASSSASATNLTPGSYTITVQDQNSCSGTVQVNMP